jgi:hypothetical protein
MTRREALAVMAMLKTAYPTFYKNYSKDEINAAVDLWATMFADDPAYIVTEAVKSLMCTLKYPPTIADVKEKIHLLTQPQGMSELEAWNTVRRAISYYDAQENYNSLPPMLQKIVGSPNQLREWAQMDADTVNSVIQSNFMRSFRAKVAQEKEQSMLPESTKRLIHQITSGMDVNALPEKGGSSNEG